MHRFAALLHAWQAVCTSAFFATTLKVCSAGKVFKAWPQTCAGTAAMEQIRDQPLSNIRRALLSRRAQSAKLR